MEILLKVRHGADITVDRDGVVSKNCEIKGLLYFNPMWER